MHKSAGFTLLELITVLLLVGILAAVALPRLPVGGQFEQRLQADSLMGLLRLAQLRAMNDPEAALKGGDLQRCSRVIITATGFSLTQNCDLSLTLLADTVLEEHAGQGLFLGAGNLDIEASKALPLILQFGSPAAGSDFLSEDSRLGRPFIILAGNPVLLTEPLDIILGGKTVRVETEGYIHAP
ncbi:prepilin-type N-terminal cleavage/methylation domain-containing protein [Zobellella aerophila]|uniref:MSHA biogenesis protein MshC n=1 Tax=Zobellella aerophila TaxID=870480 RepID=A0ABP6VBD7_9GAMM